MIRIRSIITILCFLLSSCDHKHQDVIETLETEAGLVVPIIMPYASIDTLENGFKVNFDPVGRYNNHIKIEWLSHYNTAEMSTEKRNDIKYWYSIEKLSGGSGGDFYNIVIWKNLPQGGALISQSVQGEFLQGRSRIWGWGVHTSAWDTAEGLYLKQ